MTNADDTTNLEAQLADQRRTLAVLIRQLASLGAAYAPPGVHTGIAETRSEIARLKAALRAAGVAVEDQADDVDVSIRPARKQPSWLAPCVVQASWRVDGKTAGA